MAGFADILNEITNIAMRSRFDTWTRDLSDTLIESHCIFYFEDLRIKVFCHQDSTS